MPTQTALGLTLAVSAGEPATYDIAGFAALTFIDVGDVETVPEFGGSSQVIEFINITTGLVQKFKGSFNAGSLSVNLGRDITDVGQIVLKDGAVPTDNTVHSFSFTETGGDIIYVTGIVTSYTVNYSDANSVTKATVVLELDNQAIAGQ